MYEKLGWRRERKGNRKGWEYGMEGRGEEEKNGGKKRGREARARKKLECEVVGEREGVRKLLGVRNGRRVERGGT